MQTMVKNILSANCGHKNVLAAGAFYLLGYDEIISQLDVALGFLGERTEPEPLDLLGGQPADADDVEVEDGVLGHGVMTHLEDNRLVGTAGFVHLLAGRGPQFVHRPGDAGGAGIRGGECFRRDI